MFRRFIAILVCIAFITSYYQPAYAQGFSINQLPVPGSMINTTPAYVPLTLKGLIIHPENALKFDFLMDPGRSNLKGNDLKDEALKIMKYFLTALTIPEDDLWVNLSPYEKDRIIQYDLGQTMMGRDLLAQDYILKQLSSSLIYPEKTLGKEFWRQVYSKAAKEYGTTQIPVNTFNKVWIVPSEAVVWEHEGRVLIVKSRLKVMLEEDYLSLSKHQVSSNTHSLALNIVRNLVLPVLEKEVNEGKDFAQLRQMYQAMILATWYKKALKTGILNKVYADQKKTKGIDDINRGDVESIYHRYLKAFKKGAFNYIKDDIDPSTGQAVPRKYFSGGFSLSRAMVGGKIRTFALTLAIWAGSFLALSTVQQREIEAQSTGPSIVVRVQEEQVKIGKSVPSKAVPRTRTSSTGPKEFKNIPVGELTEKIKNLDFKAVDPDTFYAMFVSINDKNTFDYLQRYLRFLIDTNGRSKLTGRLSSAFVKGVKYLYDNKLTVKGPPMFWLALSSHARGINLPEKDKIGAWVSEGLRRSAAEVYSTSPNQAMLSHISLWATLAAVVVAYKTTRYHFLNSEIVSNRLYDLRNGSLEERASAAEFFSVKPNRYKKYADVIFSLLPDEIGPSYWEDINVFPSHIHDMECYIRITLALEKLGDIRGRQWLLAMARNELFNKHSLLALRKGVFKIDAAMYTPLTQISLAQPQHWDRFSILLQVLQFPQNHKALTFMVAGLALCLMWSTISLKFRIKMYVAKSSDEDQGDQIGAMDEIIECMRHYGRSAMSVFSNIKIDPETRLLIFREALKKSTFYSVHRWALEGIDELLKSDPKRKLMVLEETLRDPFVYELSMKEIDKLLKDDPYKNEKKLSILLRLFEVENYEGPVCRTAIKDLRALMPEEEIVGLFQKEFKVKYDNLRPWVRNMISEEVAFYIFVNQGSLQYSIRQGKQYSRTKINRYSRRYRQYYLEDVLLTEEYDPVKIETNFDSEFTELVVPGNQSWIPEATKHISLAEIDRFVSQVDGPDDRIAVDAMDNLEAIVIGQISNKTTRLIIEGMIRNKLVNIIKKDNEGIRRSTAEQLIIALDNDKEELSAARHLGGIALNAKMMDLQIKRDGNAEALSMSRQSLDMIDIQGFVPRIISIQSVDLSALLGLADRR